MSLYKNDPEGRFYIIIECRRRESNPYGFLRTILSRVRLPVPPLRQEVTGHTVPMAHHRVNMVYYFAVWLV